MKPGQSKLKRALGIVAIVAFIGFFIMRYEMFVMVVNDPVGVVNGFLDHPVEFTLYKILRLLGFILGAASPYLLLE